MDLANWALRTSPKFTTGIKYQFHQVFDKIRDLEIPITIRPLYITFFLTASVLVIIKNTRINKCLCLIFKIK